MPAQWLSNSSDLSGRVTASLAGALRALAQPQRARRLRQVLLLLFALWAVFALARLIWALFPTAEAPVEAPVVVINPISTGGSTGSVETIDIGRMMGWHLFGEAGASVEVAVVEPDTAALSTARDGIEDGARETRLKLKLRGIVASTQDGLGHAIIEHNARQAVYAVEDKLPVSGRVVLAKVMPRQVVLDNGGNYELLVLFEDSKLGSQLSSPREPVAARRPGPAREIDKRSDAGTTALAQSYRQRLYQNPQSLAEVVSVTAVREDGTLLGYRVSPGKDREQFTQLGFKSGDLVTGVNGIALNDPANTMRLYQAMRSAAEAVFELQREDEQLTISVSLDSGGPQ